MASKQRDFKKINWPSEKIASLGEHRRKAPTGDHNLVRGSNNSKQHQASCNLHRLSPKPKSPERQVAQEDEFDEEDCNNNSLSIITLASLDGRTMVTGNSAINKQSININSNNKKKTFATAGGPVAMEGKRFSLLQGNQTHSSFMQIPQQAGGNSRQSLANASSSANGGSSAAASSSQLHLPQTASSSTTHLHPAHQHQRQSTLTIKQNVHLKYVKFIIILLLAIDLVITITAYKFAINDQMSFWLLSAYKFRFSTFNLVLSSTWYIILIGAILFDVYAILMLASLVDVTSVSLLLVFSGIHLTKRVDYDSVNMISLLTLLFAIIMLLMYLLLMTSLKFYLLGAVKQRLKNKSSSRL